MGLDLRKDLAPVSCFVGVCCIQCEQVTFFEVVKQEQSQEVLLLPWQVEQKNYL